MSRRLAIIASHPVQYYGPLYRELAGRMDVHVFYAHRASPADQAKAGFGTAFDWDVDITAGHDHSFLSNVSKTPGVGAFSGCDTPGIGKELESGRFDAAMTMGWHLKSFIQGILSARRLGLPVMVRGDSQLATPRGSLKKFGKRLAYPPFLRVFDAALYVGQRSKAYYQHYRYPADRLFFSPHCIDTRWFAERASAEARTTLRKRLEISEPTKLVLFAGKLVPFKRPLDVVAAIRRCRDQGLDMEMLVAGDGELRAAILQSARDARVPVHMLGFCNQSQMPPAYAAADCLVLPSDSRETWGLVANEALACGRPVVVSDACGCAPDLGGEGAGRTFRSADIESLAGALRDLIRQPPTQEAIAGLSGKHSVKAAADGVESAIARLVRAR